MKRQRDRKRLRERKTAKETQRERERHGEIHVDRDIELELGGNPKIYSYNAIYTVINMQTHTLYMFSSIPFRDLVTTHKDNQVYIVDHLPYSGKFLEG